MEANLTEVKKTEVNKSINYGSGSVHIVVLIFLAKRNLAFRGLKETLGLPHNGKFSGLFELAKGDPVLNKLQNRIVSLKFKQHYLTKDIQNELINLIAKEAEKVLLTYPKQAKYFAVILN